MAFKIEVRLSEGAAFRYDLVYDYGSRKVVRGYIHSDLRGKVWVTANLTCPKYTGYQAMANVDLDVYAPMSSRELAYIANKAIMDAQKRLDEHFIPARISYYEKIVSTLKLSGKAPSKDLRHVLQSDTILHIYSVTDLLEHRGLLVVREDRISVESIPTTYSLDDSEDLPF